ncbi:MAG: ferredoxin--NADP reductase [Ignavibacteriae bacterium]|nr:ferredoxin--NADP reductase [Ignavibacteriota bacterium]MCB9244505.1 ferredoxin--NADP reductase [Ignavibacteriales bacterium]
MSRKYHPLKVSKVVKDTKDAVAISFDIPSELSDSFKYKQGQFLSLQLKIDGNEVRREYSLSSSPYLDEPITIASKKVPKGFASKFLYDSVNEGDIIEVFPPQGKFFTELDPENEKFYFLIGGGSGITPLFSILRSILKVEPKSKVILYYGNNREEDIMFYDELRNLSSEYPNTFKLYLTLNEPGNNWTGLSGIINKAYLLRIIEETIYIDKESVEYFICGPEVMMVNVVSWLESIGIPAEKIHREYFTAPYHHQQETVEKEDGVVTAEEGEPASELKPRVVKVKLDNDEFEVDVKPGQVIIDAVKDAGYDPPFSCLSGICTTCRARLKSGKVEMDEREGLSDAEINDGYILTCQSHPLSDDVSIDYE